MDEPMDVDDEVDDTELNKFILNHVFLPRYLPPENPTPAKEFRLMEKMIENVLDTPLVKQTLLPNTAQLFEQLKEIHIDSSANDFDGLNEILKSKISSLASGDARCGHINMFAIYMHLHNCLLFIHKRAEKVILTTFRSDIKPGPDCQSDIEVKFSILI